MAQTLLPRVVLVLLIAFGGALLFFESVYLRDQAGEFREPRIAGWMWAFRGLTILSAFLIVAVIIL